MSSGKVVFSSCFSEMGLTNSVMCAVGIEQIRKEVMEHPVVLFTRAKCGYCTLAKELLDDEKIQYVEKDLDAYQVNRFNSQMSVICCNYDDPSSEIKTDLKGLMRLSRQVLASWPKLPSSNEFTGTN